MLNLNNLEAVTFEVVSKIIGVFEELGLPVAIRQSEWEELKQLIPPKRRERIENNIKFPVRIDVLIRELNKIFPEQVAREVAPIVTAGVGLRILNYLPILKVIEIAEINDVETIRLVIKAYKESNSNLAKFIDALDDDKLAQKIIKAIVKLNTHYYPAFIPVSKLGCLEECLEG